MRGSDKNPENLTAQYDSRAGLGCSLGKLRVSCVSVYRDLLNHKGDILDVRVE